MREGTRTNLHLAAAAAALCTTLAVTVWYATPAYPQPCIDFDSMDQFLKTEFDEHWHIVAAGAEGSTYLFYGNPGSGTWTIVALTNGCALVLASGTGYDALEVLPGVPS
jgi:hypothetical protein